MSAYNARYAAENPGVIRAARLRNRDAQMIYQALYRAENRELRRAATASWAARNGGQRRATAAARRARKAANGAFKVTANDVRRLLIRLNHTCAYCPASLSAGFHLDHVMPIARGGSHSIGNLTAACARCNLAKGARTVMEWRMRQSA